MNAHEVYPNAPLVLATVEVRHPAAPPLTATERTAVKEALAKWTPILRSTNQVSFEAIVGSAADAHHQTSVEEFPKYFSRDNMLAVSLRTASTVIETTRYEGWTSFLELIHETLTTRIAASQLDGIERIGIRCINEIRIPGDTPSDWSDWLNPPIVPSPSLESAAGMPVTQWQGATIFGQQPGNAVVLRYGLRDGYAVASTPELRRELPNPGPFMWIDIDSFWTPGEETPEFDLDRTVDICDKLHDPVRTIFESLITDRLRDEVLRSA